MTSLMTIKDIMSECQVGRATATRWLNEKGCPVFSRGKGKRYLVPREEFYQWLLNTKS